MARADDLTTLFPPSSAEGVGYRKGTVVAWDPVTGENAIEIPGATLTNLSFAAGLTLTPTDTVAVITTPGGSWFILCRLVTPPL